MTNVDVVRMAICIDCGWEGPWREVSSLARNDGDSHECRPPREPICDIGCNCPNCSGTKGREPMRTVEALGWFRAVSQPTSGAVIGTGGDEMDAADMEQEERDLTFETGEEDG